MVCKVKLNLTENFIIDRKPLNLTENWQMNEMYNKNTLDLNWIRNSEFSLFICWIPLLIPSIYPAYLFQIYQLDYFPLFSSTQNRQYFIRILPHPSPQKRSPSKVEIYVRFQHHNSRASRNSSRNPKFDWKFRNWSFFILYLKLCLWKFPRGSYPYFSIENGNMKEL